MRKVIASGVLFLIALGSIGCGDDGPQIFVDLNVRLLCARTISGVDEARCMAETAATDCEENQFCWAPKEYVACEDSGTCTGGTECAFEACRTTCSEHSQCDDSEFCIGDDGQCSDPSKCTNGHCVGTFGRGFCRECMSDGECPAGYCDHGWCHAGCSQDSDCSAGEMCTDGLCRRPYFDGLEFAFSNKGNRDLKVFTDRTKIYGSDDACAFATWIWDKPEAEVIVPPDGNVNLRLYFRPTEKKKYLAYMQVYSNSMNNNPLQLFFCGYGVEASCDLALDPMCPACACEEDDFKDILKNLPEPSCP